MDAYLHLEACNAGLGADHLEIDAALWLPEVEHLVSATRSRAASGTDALHKEGQDRTLPAVACGCDLGQLVRVE